MKIVTTGILIVLLAVIAVPAAEAIGCVKCKSICFLTECEYFCAVVTEPINSIAPDLCSAQEDGCLTSGTCIIGVP